MTITLDIRPETKEELARQAAARGLGVGAYAASLLEEAAHAASDKPLPAAVAKGYLRHFGVSISILSATETQAGRLTCEGIFG
jgi:hypothetical protein